jgi:hypothetical protein
MEASWKDRTVRAGDFVANTKRGQLAASVRFMAKAWNWTPAKAQRFLKRLEKLEMVYTKADTGVTVITICKYDQYQNAPKASNTGLKHPRYATNTNEKKDSIPEGRKNEEMLIPFVDFWHVWPNKTAKAAAEKAWDRLVQSERIEAKMRAQLWFQTWRSRNPQASPIHPASYLNQKRWTDDMQTQPIAATGGNYGTKPSKSETFISAFVGGAQNTS